jgi:hypothetical protein
MNVARFAVACLIGAIGAYIVIQAKNVRYVKSGDKTYRVVNSPNYQAAADTLAKLEARARDLLVKCETVVPGNRQFANIRARWSGNLREIDGNDSSIAYSVGKKDIWICVRKQDGTIENFNDTMFVLLHELSHIANETYGHNDDFWKTFKFVLEVAERTGVYAFQDYGRKSVRVCGKEISTTPLACVKNGECFSELGPIRPL